MINKKKWLLGILCFIFGFISGGVACFIMAIFADMSHTETTEKPAFIAYHNARDLYEATGVMFPEVTPVDTLGYESFNINYTMVKFVPNEKLTEDFFHSLDEACRNDSNCWKKDNGIYKYYILPEQPFDRTKGSGWRKVEMDGKMVDDWDGLYFMMDVPDKGDTITVEYGWKR